MAAGATATPRQSWHRRRQESEPTRMMSRQPQASEERRRRANPLHPSETSKRRPRLVPADAWNVRAEPTARGAESPRAAMDSGERPERRRAAANPRGRRRRARVIVASAAAALCFAQEALAFQHPLLRPPSPSRVTSLATSTKVRRDCFTSPSRLRGSSAIQMVLSSPSPPSPSSSIDQNNTTATAAEILEQVDANMGLAAAEIPRDGGSERIATNLELVASEDPLQSNDDHNSLPPLLQKVADKVGKIDESRLASSPEYLSGEVPKLYSNLRYETVVEMNERGDATEVVRATNSKASFWSSAALLCGTALGCGLLTLPAAVGNGAGYLPTLVATLVAWGYMTVSALLTSELLINRAGETGRPRNVGLLELYTSYLGDAGGKLAGVGFLVVSYLVMGVYLSEGGDLLARLSDVKDAGASVWGGPSADPAFLSRALFAAAVGTFLSAAARFNTVQRAMTHVLFPATILALLAAAAAGLPTADFSSLLALENQHPEVVLNAFPLLFMGWTYHGVVPRVVYDLEGNKDEITKAIVLGSTTAFVIYGVWTAAILGNAGAVAGTSTTAAVAKIGDAASSSLPSLVAVASELAVVTSLIGVVLSFVNEFHDAVYPSPTSRGPEEDGKWKVALLTLLPPAIASVALGYSGIHVDNYEIVDYTGIFGSSVLFLILPALMAWQNRYAEEDPPRPLTVRPMVPLGKVTLGSLYKAAGTLIAEQGLEKLGVFDFVRDRLHL